MYGAAAILALFECTVLWLALHPNVGPVYRGYYIDKTTTCLDQAVAGTYAFGTLQSFTSGSEDAIKPIRVCGWEGPAGDGLHAVGESAMLRFAMPPDAHNLKLQLQLVAIGAAPDAGMPVKVAVNGVAAGELLVMKDPPQTFELAVPKAAEGPALTVELAFPTAIKMGPQDSNTRKRSIKLSAAGVFPAGS